MWSNVILTFFLLSVSALVKAENARLKQDRYELTYSLADSSHQVLKIKGSLLVSSGENEQTLLSFLNKKLKPRINTHVILHMFGGDLALVNKAYKIIKSKCHSERYSFCNIKTEVEMFRHCASACIPLFMVGDTRIAAERTNWGFHQAATLGGYLKIPFMAEYVLKSKGVNPNWIKKNKKMFSTLKMTWIQTEGLRGSNILTHIIAHPN